MHAYQGCVFAAQNVGKSENHVKVVSWDTLVDNGFSGTAAFATVEAHISEGIKRITWPEGNDAFVIYPEKDGNGVKPIKAAFIAHLISRGWIPEVRRFDAHYSYESGFPLPFVVEWETGNISSSHRAINRMAMGMLETSISGGVLIVPSRALYKYLTDRVGNAQELVPYHPLWRLWSQHAEFNYLAIVTIEHDGESLNVPRIAKGTDGRALI